MSFVVTVVPPARSIDLQATLSASSAVAVSPPLPHHPITCTSTLAFHEDGALECEHGRVPGDDQRTRHCVDHSVAILLIELLREREDTDAVVPRRS